MNLAAVDAGVNHIHKVVVPESWKTAADEAPTPKLVGRDKAHTDYLNDILVPTNTLTGDAVPVSTFLSTVNGMIPSGTAAYEKRGIAADLPKWDFTKCMQCNWCSYVCPHGVIRPFVLNDAEAEGVDGVLNMKGTKDKKFTIAISALDCTGCGSCAQVCPAREKALEMIPAETEYMDEQQAKYNGLFGNVTDKEIPFKEDTVKGSQFRQPLMEFSGACPGCGESPYAKLITQLFGERMFIANATGCSSIWGCSAPSSPYTVNKEGKGPAWANSLFEDNAEFGFGMSVSVEARRNELKSAVERLNDVLGVPARAWLASFNDAKQSKVTGDILLAECLYFSIARMAPKVVY